MDIISKILFGWIVAIFFLFAYCSDERVEKAMREEILSHQNVVAINKVSRESDRKCIIGIDISLKNDVRMYISGCKMGKNNDIVYEDVRMVNGWFLWKVAHYEDSDKYYCSRASDIEESLMGNSLEYLLDNYQKLYDFYMSAPELDSVSESEIYSVSSERLQEIFDNTSDECMQDIYENGKMRGARKLYRVKSTNYEFYQH